MDHKIKDSLISLLLIITVVGSFFFHLSYPLIASFLTLFSVLYHAQLLGSRLFLRSSFITSTLGGLFLFLALHSLFQTVWFYAGWKLGAASDTWIMVASILFVQAVAWIIPSSLEKDSRPRLRLTHLLGGASLVMLGAILAMTLLYPAWKVGTLASIRTPWPLLPEGSLIIIAALWALLFIANWLGSMPAVNAWLSGIALGATTALAPLIYRLGFGFDGFLHIASEKILLQTGTLTPAPPYYIGQYVFTTWLARVSDLSLASLDRWLVPIACALLLPFAAYLSSTTERKPSFFPFFLLPLAPFVATTPQSFSYLLGLTAILLAFGANRTRWLAPVLLGAWSVAVHPLAGVPFFFLTCALLAAHVSAHEQFRLAKRIFAVVSALAAACAIPLLFYIFSLKGSAALHWNFSSLFSLRPWWDQLLQLLPFQQNYFVLWPAWSSLMDQALLFILAICSILSFREVEAEQRWKYLCVFLTSSLLIAASVVLKTAGDFAFLIDYERGNYADRLLILATLCLLPASAPWLQRKISELRFAPPTIATASLIAFVACGSALSYNALPRHDALVTGRGWSVGGSDLEAVRFIDRDAGTRAYSVLANQSVSAAAVSQHGFKRYAPGDVFYYPIPTGGPLYELYLKLTYGQPTLDTVKDAGVLAQSDLVYVAINDYWWKADELTETLGSIAQDQWTFGNANKGLGNVVHVFKFDLKTPSKAVTQPSGS